MKPLDARQPRPRGGRRSRDKGNRTERAIVAFLQNSGFAAERVPLSGSAGGKYVGDVTIPLLGRDMCAEVKVRVHGFGQLYAWLDGREILIVRQDLREPLVILPLRLAAEIAGHAERNSREIQFNQPKKCPTAMAGQRNYTNARNSENRGAAQQRRRKLRSIGIFARLPSGGIASRQAHCDRIGLGRCGAAAQFRVARWRG